MSENFFDLSTGNQADIINGVALHLGKPAQIIEKDVWVCQILQDLFGMDIPMVFKGGTSLSKGYGLIDRFSEDVDVTVDYKYFQPNLDISQIGNKSQGKKIGEQLKKSVLKLVDKEITNHLKKRFKVNFKNAPVIEHNKEKERLEIFYATVVSPEHFYIKPVILLEYGGKNSIVPSESKEIVPFLTEYVSELELPKAFVNTLSPIRTFWEKATLIHVKCHSGRIISSPDRLSRHWYDIGRLSDSWVLSKALQAKNVLEDVVAHKKVFFYTSYDHYDDCLAGKLRLIPDESDINVLKEDYEKMQSSGMLSVEPLSFDVLLGKLKVLEGKLNQLFQK